MKLPPDFQIDTLKSLRHWFMTQGDQKPQELEMSEAQYIRYKQLVYEADFIRRFMGVPIALSPKEPSTSADGSL